VTTPADYPGSLVASLWGNVCADPSMGVVGDDIEALAASTEAATDDEQRRRELAAQRPGLGTLLPLPQPPSGPATGKYDVAGPVVGEGYDITPDVVAAVTKSYGTPRPICR
jgi:hypothetical protein